MGRGIKVGPFGGSGGHDFVMEDADHLVSIKIRHGEAIDAIIVTYDINGTTRTVAYGGGGGLESEIKFHPGEFLCGISGHFGSFENILVVRSLTFHTNLRTPQGPYGEKEGTLFSVPVENSKIIGFFGRSGQFLDAVGVSMVLN